MTSAAQWAARIPSSNLRKTKKAKTKTKTLVYSFNWDFCIVYEMHLSEDLEAKLNFPRLHSGCLRFWNCAEEEGAAAEEEEEVEVTAAAVKKGKWAGP